MLAQNTSEKEDVMKVSKKVWEHIEATFNMFRSHANCINLNEELFSHGRLLISCKKNQKIKSLRNCCENHRYCWEK